MYPCRALWKLNLDCIHLFALICGILAVVTESPLGPHAASVKGRVAGVCNMCILSIFKLLIWFKPRHARPQS